jgi:hypothetical protein
MEQLRVFTVDKGLVGAVSSWKSSPERRKWADADGLEK